MEPRAWILNTVGMCLKNIGRGNLAEVFYKRALDIYLDIEDWTYAQRVLMNLSDSHSYKGELAKSLQSADNALELARRTKRKDYEVLVSSLPGLGLSSAGRPEES